MAERLREGISAVQVDLKREIAAYTAPRGRFEVRTVPPLQYLAIDGHGDPNTSAAYADALATVYPVAYTLRAVSKSAGRPYTVMPLEALWWSDDPAAFTTARDTTRWDWTVLNLVPDWLTRDDVEAAVATVAGRGRGPALEALRLEELQEGLCVQMLYVGPYDDEGPVLAAMHDEFVPGASLRLTGKHHEVYLSDPRRTAPQRLRTILRQPVEPA